MRFQNFASYPMLAFYFDNPSLNITENYHIYLFKIIFTEHKCSAPLQIPQFKQTQWLEFCNEQIYNVHCNMLQCMLLGICKLHAYVTSNICLDITYA